MLNFMFFIPFYIMSGNIETDIINKFNELTQKVKNSS